MPYKCGNCSRLQYDTSPCSQRSCGFKTGRWITSDDPVPDHGDKSMGGTELLFGLFYSWLAFAFLYWMTDGSDPAANKKAMNMGIGFAVVGVAGVSLFIVKIVDFFKD